MTVSRPNLGTFASIYNSRPESGPMSIALITPRQCFRCTRVHHCIQRPQARQVDQVDHLQDLGRLEGDCRRRLVDRGQLLRLPREAPQRKEQGPKRQRGHRWQIRRLRCRVRHCWRGQEVCQSRLPSCRRTTDVHRRSKITFIAWVPDDASQYVSKSVPQPCTVANTNYLVSSPA